MTDWYEALDKRVKEKQKQELKPTLGLFIVVIFGLGVWSWVIYLAFR